MHVTFFHCIMQVKIGKNIKVIILVFSHHAKACPLKSSRKIRFKVQIPEQERFLGIMEIVQTEMKAVSYHLS